MNEEKQKSFHKSYRYQCPSSQKPLLFSCSARAEVQIEAELALISLNPDTHLSIHPSIWKKSIITFQVMMISWHNNWELKKCNQLQVVTGKGCTV